MSSISPPLLILMLSPLSLLALSLSPSPPLSLLEVTPLWV